eukprot:40026_1
MASETQKHEQETQMSTYTIGSNSNKTENIIDQTQTITEQETGILGWIDKPNPTIRPSPIDIQDDMLCNSRVLKGKRWLGTVILDIAIVLVLCIRNYWRPHTQYNKLIIHYYSWIP